jgi:hypothetical protein
MSWKGYVESCEHEDLLESQAEAIFKDLEAIIDDTGPIYHKIVELKKKWKVSE